MSFFPHVKAWKTPLVVAGLLVAVATWVVADEVATRPSFVVPVAVNAAPPFSERFATLQTTDAPSFRRHVLPLFGRVGCSARDCHGSFQGRGGFQLSLFGYDFEHDHKQITQDSTGDEGQVRINAGDPLQSLILLKPTLQMKHKGKQRFPKDGWEYNLILKWIQSGAKNDAPQTGEFGRLEVSPSEVVLHHPGESVQLHVTAYWKDGTVEDVTQLARFRTNDDSVATVAEGGKVECVAKGDTHVVAFYDNGILPVPVMVPASEQNGPSYPPVATHTKVDELVVAKLRKVGIVPSELCTDAEFLRRASLDVTGTLPSPDEITKFLADPSPDKRTAKIDELLHSPAYAGWWATRFCDYTGNSARVITDGDAINAKGNTGDLARQWYSWLYKRIADNAPYDQIAEGIVLATSRTSAEENYKDFALEMVSYFRHDAPADFAMRPNLPYFWQRRTVQKPEEKALAFAHTFLGVRIECAQCHKHPFDQWTKTDFEQFQAFFAPIAFGKRPALKGEDVSFASVTKEIRDKVTAELGSAMQSDEMSAMPANPNMALAPGATAKGAPTTAPTTGPTIAVRPAKKPLIAPAAEASAPSPTTAPTTGPSTAPAAKPAVVQNKKNDAEQLATRAEDLRRRQSGEMLPWSEVYVDRSRIGKLAAQKNKAEGSSRVITPKLLGGEQVVLQQYADPREPIMAWLKDPHNPYFARALVNRVWANYFHRGIVEPADDLNLANAPSNAELLQYLTDGFIAHGFDMRWLHREILTSETYQRSWRTNDTNRLDERNFSHAVVRRLPAEVMVDAIDMATASRDRALAFATDLNDRAIGPAGNAGGGRTKGDGYALTLFGRSTRETNCDCERRAEPTLMQTLYTRNDPELLARIEGSKGQPAWMTELRRTYARQQMTDADRDKLVNEIFLRTVSRPATTEEISKATTDLTAAKTPVDGLRDLLWVMLNTREFRVNH